MNNRTRFYLLIIAFLVIPLRLVFAKGQKIKPVTPKPSLEVVALLDYLQGLSGNHILSGQHNFPISRDRNTQFAADYIGKTPVVWSQDFGFAKDGDKDSYLARPSIVQEAIRQHKLGAIVNLCWHAVPPTADEPVTFQPVPGADPNNCASVQGKLTDQQWKDLFTPGTAIYKNWEKQVDEIAGYLKQLEDAHVPVLWRPYHEMNGDWFWWGGVYEGKYTTKRLYQQIYDRYVKHHKIKNLIWIWSVDKPEQPGREFINYYPGNEYLDILAIDIYGEVFKQEWYDGLMALSEGKPITLGEVGIPPRQEVLDQQPNWLYWVVWSGMVRGTPVEEYEKLTADSRYVFMEDKAFLEGTMDYRKACGMEPIVIDRSADFTGEWRMDERESVVQNMGPTSTPYKLTITQKNNELNVKAVSVVEWADDEVTDQTYFLDGREMNSVVFNNSPRVQHANWSTEKDTLTITSRVNLNFGDRPVELNSKDVWALGKRGKKLVIFQTADGFMGRPQRESTIIYYKQ